MAKIISNLGGPKVHHSTQDFILCIALCTNVVMESKKDQVKKPKEFKSTIGVIFSCLGCVIGTGNVWRFPRILAKNSGPAGAGSFLIVWFCCLFLWSIPLLVVEYTIGRFTRMSPIRMFTRIWGRFGFSLGGWVVFVIFFIGSYYLVILGWCLYYVYLPIRYQLPSEEDASSSIFNEYTESKWSFIPFTIALLVVSASVMGGIKAIEKVNTVLVPLLLLILLSLFFYSSTLKYSEYGISFLFSGDWNTLLQPSLYLDAISQTAFDTGAGNGLIAAYSMYLTRSNSVLRYSVFIPIVNNGVSLLASMTILPTVFGIMMTKDPTITQSGIVSILQGGGLAGTGLTFTWMPILMETLGVFGRFVCSIFFVCLSFAGVSSLISMVELQTLTLMEFGLNRKVSVVLISGSMFLLGTASVLNLNFLVNQDYVWGLALIVSGLVFVSLVYRYGPMKYRNDIVNAIKSDKDFNLPFIWVIVITIVAPIEAIALLLWWIYSEVTEQPLMWYKPGWMTIITTWIEWAVFATVLIVVNIILIKLKFSWVVNSGGDVQKENKQHKKLVTFDNSTFEVIEDTEDPKYAATYL